MGRATARRCDTMPVAIDLPTERIATFCQKWGVGELAIFGSVLRDDFGPDSDVDVLVTFRPGASMTFEGFLDMREELSQIFGRQIDLVEKRLVRTPSGGTRSSRRRRSSWDECPFAPSPSGAQYPTLFR